MEQPKFGSQVKDRITGLTGIVTGKADYITGCTQFLVQPRIKEGGDFIEGRWLDIDRLDVIIPNAVTLPSTADGPDAPAPVK